MERATIEEGRRRGGEEEAREEFVELDGALVLVLPFIEGEAEADAHPEELGRLDATTADVNQIAVVDGLQSHVVELKVTVRLEGCGDLLEVELQELRGETVGGDTFLKVGLEAGGMSDSDVVVVLESGQGLPIDRLQQETRRDVAVGGIHLDT